MTKTCCDAYPYLRAGRCPQELPVYYYDWAGFVGCTKNSAIENRSAEVVLEGLMTTPRGKRRRLRGTRWRWRRSTPRGPTGVRYRLFLKGFFYFLFRAVWGRGDREPYCDAAIPVWDRERMFCTYKALPVLLPWPFRLHAAG